ncbi:MAG TPA: hypothetical protein PKK82_03250 [Anaerolineaceae bacterium]|nr:hypothetical protein [Anaerolineaceae bacterium]
MTVPHFDNPSFLSLSDQKLHYRKAEGIIEEKFKIPEIAEPEAVEFSGSVNSYEYELL